MKRGLFLLMVFFFLSGCSDKTKSPVATGNALSKGVLATYAFTGTPLELISTGTSIKAGNHMIFKGQIVKGSVICENEMINGVIQITVNRELTLLTGEGQLHGTLILTPAVHPDGEYWSGTFTGTRVKTGENEWTSYLKQDAKGHNGSIEGLHYYVQSTLIHTDIWGEGGYVSQGTGYIR